MKFLGNVLSTVVGLFVFIMICIFGIMIIGVIFGGSEEVSVDKNSVIVLDLKHIKNDYSGKYTDPIFTIFSPSEGVVVAAERVVVEAAPDDVEVGQAIRRL